VKFIKPDLNERELQLIEMVCNGHTNKEIAALIGKSVRTAEGYRLKIMQTTKSKNVAGLVAFALQNGIIHKKEDGSYNVLENLQDKIVSLGEMALQYSNSVGPQVEGGTKFLNHFTKTVETANIQSLARAVWLELFCKSFSLQWKRTFKHSLALIQERCDTSRTRLIEALAKLEEVGLIEYDYGESLFCLFESADDRASLLATG